MFANSESVKDDTPNAVPTNRAVLRKDTGNSLSIVIYILNFCYPSPNTSAEHKGGSWDSRVTPLLITGVRKAYQVVAKPHTGQVRCVRYIFFAGTAVRIQRGSLFFASVVGRDEVKGEVKGR